MTKKEKLSDHLRVKDYIKLEFDWDVKVLNKYDEHWPSVWKAEVTPDKKAWKVDAPDVLYCVDEVALNCYLPSAFNVTAHGESSTEDTLVDMIRSLHMGIMVRMGMVKEK